jgi:hypothetical protein
MLCLPSTHERLYAAWCLLSLQVLRTAPAHRTAAAAAAVQQRIAQPITPTADAAAAATVGEQSTATETIQALNRNNREVKKANHGKRAVNRRGRRAKKNFVGRR